MYIFKNSAEIIDLVLLTVRARVWTRIRTNMHAYEYENGLATLFYAVFE